MKNSLIIFVFLLYTIENRIFSTKNNTIQFEKARKLVLSNKDLKKSYSLKNLDNKERGKLNFMKVMLKILKNAHEKKLDIKQIKIGNGIKKLFKNPFMVDDMKSFLKSRNLKNKINVMKKKIKKEERKLVIKSKKEKRDIKRRLGVMDSVKSAAKGGGAAAAAAPANTMGFNFLPGFAGMPFPPFMMQGPHFHPPINMTVNSIPNPNPQADLNPFEIEQSNLKTQLDELGGIKTKLLGLGSKMNSIDQQISDGLEDKYTKIMQLNV